MLTKTEIRLRISASVLVAAAFAMTRPSVKIYFVSRISQQVFAMSDLICIGLLAMVSGYLENKNSITTLRRKWFAWFTISDTILYGVLSIAGLYIDPAIRFIGLAIAESLFTIVSFILLRDAVNIALSGSDLTSFQNRITKVESLSGFIALAVFMLVDFDIPVETAIAIQFITLVIVCVIRIIFIRSINRREANGEFDE